MKMQLLNVCELTARIDFVVRPPADLAWYTCKYFLGKEKPPYKIRLIGHLPVLLLQRLDVCDRR